MTDQPEQKITEQDPLQDPLDDFPSSELFGGATMVTGSIFFNKYKIVGRIGSGGMSHVYNAHDLMLDKNVAVKVLKYHTDDPDQTIWNRFRQEAKSAHRLSHPNIIRTYECNISEDGRPFLVMDLIDGQALSQIIEERKSISEERFLKLMIQVCDGLEHAHKNGITHRDIKPSNIVILNADGEERAIILDFGIAKLHTLEGPEATQLTRTGEVFGTPAYMSPEQVQCTTLDARSDIYSMGCLMYELICGKPPFLAEAVIKTLMEQCKSTPEPLSKRNAEVNPAIEAIVMKCLEKDPANRYQSASDLGNELKMVQAHKGTPAALQAVKFKRMKRFFLVSLLVGMLIFAGLCVNVIWSNPETRSMVKIMALTEGWYYPWWTEELQNAKSKVLAARWDEAEQVLIELVKKAETKCVPNDEIWRIYGSTGAFYRDRNRFELAREYYKKCLKQGDWPCTRAQKVYLALCEMETGDLDEAYKQAKESVDFWNGIGSCEQKDNGMATSLEVLGKIQYQKALRMKNEDERAKLFQQSQDSFSQLKKLADNAPTKSRAAWLTAKAMIAQGKVDEAQAEFKEAKEIRSKLFGADDPGIKKLDAQFERLRVPPHTEPMTNSNERDQSSGSLESM